MFIHALGLLCALASATFATAPIGSARARAWFAAVAGFVGASVWLRPEPTSVGLLIAVIAGLQLAWPKRGWPVVAASGLVAGLWASLLGGQGLPGPTAWLLAASVPLASAWFARRPEFAPTAIREEALVAVCGLGALIATGPTVAAGWGSASALNLEPAGGVRQALGLWVVLLGAASIALGGWHSLRRRR